MLLLLLTFQYSFVLPKDEELLLAVGPLRLVMGSECGENCLEYQTILV